MKAVFIFLFVCLIPVVLSAQTPDWIWAKSSSGSGYCKTTDAVTDINGNIVCVGLFSSSSITFGGVTLTSTNTSIDLFIVKYDHAGDVLWAKSVAGTEMDIAEKVVIDKNNNIYIAGQSVSPSLTFGTVTISNTSGYQSPFVAKYNPDGNIIWAKNAVCESNAFVNALAVDGNNNIFVSGYFSGYSISFGGNIVYGGFNEDIYMTKYDSNGNVIWVKAEGGDYQDNCLSLSVDGSGNVYMAGTFSSSSITFGSTILTNAGLMDAFLVKYNNDGTVIWAKGAGGNSDDYPGGVTVEPNGDSYLIGTYKSSSIIFDTTTLNISYSDNEDVFLVKYSSAGDVLWAQKLWGYGTEYGQAITRDLNGNIYVSGIFSSSTLNIGTIPVSGVNPFDIFVAKINGSGSAIWVQTGKGSDDENVEAICTDAIGNAFVAGDFQSPTLTFGSIALTHVNPINNNPNLYIAKVGAPTGIDDNYKKETVSGIFPNPVQDAISINIQEGIGNLYYEIISPQGQTLLSGTLSDNKPYKIDLSSVEPGIFFIKYTKGNYSGTTKFIKL